LLGLRVVGEIFEQRCLGGWAVIKSAKGQLKSLVENRFLKLPSSRVLQNIESL